MKEKIKALFNPPAPKYQYFVFVITTIGVITWLLASTANFSTLELLLISAGLGFGYGQVIGETFFRPKMDKLIKDLAEIEVRLQILKEIHKRTFTFPPSPIDFPPNPIRIKIPQTKKGKRPN